jgi:hypothetical protein
VRGKFAPDNLFNGSDEEDIGSGSQQGDGGDDEEGPEKMSSALED